MPNRVQGSRHTACAASGTRSAATPRVGHRERGQRAMDFARPIMWNVPHWAEITLYAADSRRDDRLSGRRDLARAEVVSRTGRAGHADRPPAAPARPCDRNGWRSSSQTAVLPIAALPRRLLAGHAPGDFLGHGLPVHRHGLGHDRPGLHQSAAGLADSQRPASTCCSSSCWTCSESS